MAILRNLIFGFGLFIVFGLTFLLVRNGAFKSVEFAVEDEPAFDVLYKEHIGAYHEIIGDLNAVEAATKAAGFSCPVTFGEFLDDPGAVEQERLRSNVGCVLGIPFDSHPEGLTEKTIPARKYLVATFTGSPALGPYKVYGKAADEMQKRRLIPDGAVIEIYKVLENQGLETRYLFPVK